jgi:hypothetical protein
MDVPSDRVERHLGVTDGMNDTPPALGRSGALVIKSARRRMMRAPMSLAPGTRLGPYTTITVLGSGGMSDVYEAIELVRGHGTPGGYINLEVPMRRVLAAVTIACGGLFVGMAGQAIWRQSPDEIWTACAVVGVLLAGVVAFEPTISKFLSRLLKS